MGCRAHPRELGDQGVASKPMQTGELQNGSWMPYPENNDRTVFGMHVTVLGGFFSLKEHKVLSDIFKELTTVSLKYGGIEI